MVAWFWRSDLGFPDRDAFGRGRSAQREPRADRICQLRKPVRSTHVAVRGRSFVEGHADPNGRRSPAQIDQLSAVVAVDVAPQGAEHPHASQEAEQDVVAVRSQIGANEVRLLRYDASVATTFLAASVRSVPAIIGRPLSASIFRASSTFVPSRRTTSGTLKPTFS
jgi:hypothetical protein